MEKQVFISVPMHEFEAILMDCVNVCLKNKTEQPNPKPAQEKEYLTRKEAASMLNISLPTLWTLSKNGVIVSHRIGSRVLYKYDEVKAALTKVKTAGTN